VAADRCDVAVIGLGITGAAAALELTRRRASVIGLDRFEPPHALGSSHGRTRIIREAYFEHPLYVPLVRRAYTLWHDLERASRRRLLVPTGGLMIGAPDGTLVAGSLESARTHEVEHELLEAAEVRRRFPGVVPSPDDVAVWERRAGLLLPELCHAVMLEHARQAGAVLRTGTPALRWRAEGDGYIVETADGPIRASRVLLAGGPWMQGLVPDLELPLEVERQVLHWYRAKHAPERFIVERLPVILWEHEPERYIAFYSDTGDGVKAGIHHEGEPADPETVDRRVGDEEERRARGLLDRMMPDAAWTRVDDAVCLYTNTPDHHFIADLHPVHRRVVIASPCSGHGFKFAPALAEILADLALEGDTETEIGAFRLASRMKSGG
jgi:sarcosine oxidase